MKLKNLLSSGLVSLILASSPITTFAQQDSEVKEEQTELKKKDPSLDQIKSSVYCLRNTAIYEQVAYNNKGEIYQVKDKTESFGTGYAFKKIDGYTYLLTNYHVAYNPEISGTNAKLYTQKLEMVDNMDDTFIKDDIPLEIVALSPEKDIAVLRTKRDIKYYEPKILTRDKIKEGDKIILVGFPLAITETITEGIVSNVCHPDRYYDYWENINWNHTDIIVDLASNPGNSGSPAFILKTEDGKENYYLSGLLHAGYSTGWSSQAEGLKLVVSVDDFLSMMSVKDVIKRPIIKEKQLLSDENITKIKNYLKEDSINKFFTFGKEPASIDIKEGTIRFSLYSGDFFDQLGACETLIIEDNKTNGYGTVDKVEYKKDNKTHEVSAQNLNEPDKILCKEMYLLLVEKYLMYIQYRQVYKEGFDSKEKNIEAGYILDRIISHADIETMLKQSAEKTLSAF